MTTLTGQCFCKATEFQVVDDFKYALNCYCSNCRRATGSAFKPFVATEKSKLNPVAGGDKILKYGDDKNHNAHCGVCFSMLYSVVREGMYVHIPLGVLSETPSLLPDAHIYVGSKAPWYQIHDAHPQFEEI